MDQNWTGPTLPPAPTDDHRGMPGWSQPAMLTPEPAPVGKRWRGPLVAVLAVCALLIAGLGAVLALRDRGGAPEVEVRAVEVNESSGFSLAAAAELAVEASTMQYDMTMNFGTLGEFTVRGGVDTEAQLMTMTMDMGAFLAGAGDTGDGTIEMIIDVGGAVMYARADGAVFAADTEWVSMDLAALAEQSGMSVEDFRDRFSSNPFDVAELFTFADDVVDIGTETIDGTTVRHYQVDLDLADVLAANPQLGQQLDVSNLGADAPTEVVYDVWVTEDNQLRRMTFVLDVLGQEMSVEMNVTTIGEPLDVTIPAPADVTDFSDAFGG